MHTFIKIITEEIELYQCQNFRLQIEDLLRKTEGSKRIHQKKIKENETRIERLLDSIMEVL